MLCEARSNRPFGRGRRCLSTHPHLPLSLSLPSFPPLLLLPSHGLCLWLNAGILLQRLPVAKRDRAPEKLGKCMWVTASQKGAFYSLLLSFFSPPFCSFVLSGSLARSFSHHEWKDNIDLCLSRFFYFPGRAANARPNKIWSCVLLT